MLSEIEGSENKFNPSTFRVDLNAANIKTIAAAYGAVGQMKTRT